MQVTITAEIPDGVPVTTHIIHYLLLDALGEFCKRREPVWEYVKLRYPHGHLGDHANDVRKIAVTKNKVILAKALKDNIITLHEDGGYCGRETDSAQSGEQPS